ncbi:arabinosyltransferase domain-containing protein [Saccharopolyspora cebuensis]|uniref:Arabinosyltransferase domain-containing protein n=1 Tax=Saccharopolyspora cebuensis TaxID=418759 RepID=A0ABV4CL37_9PSEU
MALRSRPVADRDVSPRTRKARWWAALLGLAGALLAVAVPFLPVKHDVTTLRWPTSHGTESVEAPLVTYAPLWLDAEVPCAAARDLDARTTGPAVLLSTNAPDSPYGALSGLSATIDGGQVSLFSKGELTGTAPLPAGNCSLTVHADAEGTEAAVGGEQLAALTGDQRPQLTGVFSDFDDAVDDVRGMSFEARVDDRFASYATGLKLAVMALAVLCFLGSVFALRRLDDRGGRRAPRLAPSRWWRPTAQDTVVVGVLLVWWLIGAMTADDGYILTMARSAESAGYVTNYFRWFANPESPFGWHYELLALWVQISTATPWVRLPALLMGIGSWLLISRGVLPRLGRQVRRSGAAVWAAAMVFLASWLPYNNGIRPEPVVVLFTLLSLCLVERAVATRRLTPAVLGLVAAAFGLGVNPHGMVAVLPFVVAIKPLLAMVRERIRQFGVLPVLAPIAASGLVLLVAVFADQTFRSVLEAVELKQMFGPNGKWYEELSRYTLLFSGGQDGSLSRRVPVLLLILCVVTTGAVLLRRNRIRGAALGPSRRLLAMAALCFVALALTPTKHTHHFGILAAVCGAMAALTALATSSTVLRSRRNRTGFFACLMVVCAFAVTGPNAWWYVSGWGVPWFDKPPSLDGRTLSTAFLVVAAVAGIVALVEHLRLDDNGAGEGRGRALRRGTASLTIVCSLLVAGEVATFVKGIHKQWGGYSLGADSVEQIAGASCGLSDHVEVEADPRAGVLTPSARQPTVAAPSVRPTRTETADEYLAPRTQGFARDALPTGDSSMPGQLDWDSPTGFGGDDAPLWGTYRHGDGVGELRTPWYDLPERAASGELPVVLAYAGSASGTNRLTVEWGRQTADGFEIVERSRVDEDSPDRWRDHRAQAEGATQVRLVAEDRSVGQQAWLAVSAPRVPELTSMTELVGESTTFVEWPAALVHPCLRISELRGGIAEIPEYRVSGGGPVRDIGQGWSSSDAGGPFGWLNVTSSVRELPTYLRGDLDRDWGSLYRVESFAPEALPAEAALEVHTETRNGLWSPGPLATPVTLPARAPQTSDRDDPAAE